MNECPQPWDLQVASNRTRKRGGSLRRILRNPAGAIGLVIVLVVILVTVLAPQISPYDPHKQNIRMRLKPPAWVEGGSSEYLLGTDVKEVHFKEGSPPLKLGRGAIVVQADDVDGFAYALEMLLSNDELRKAMGQNAYHATVPYFTWENRVSDFLDAIGLDPGVRDHEPAT